MAFLRAILICVLLASGPVSCSEYGGAVNSVDDEVAKPYMHPRPVTFRYADQPAGRRWEENTVPSTTTEKTRYGQRLPVYNDVSTDPKILSGGANSNRGATDLTLTEPICSICTCARNLHKIFCEHKHMSYQDKQHKLQLNSSHIPKETIILQLRGYDKVEVGPDTFSQQGTQLTLIVFEDIKSLILKSYSFKISEMAEENTLLTIQFINCKIHELPHNTLTQNVADFHHREGRLDRERTMFLSVEFRRCEIGTIRKLALSAAHIRYLNITRTTIESIEERGIDLEINNLATFHESVLPILIPQSICLHANKVVFSNNNMIELQNFSLVIEADSQVKFDNNKVGLLRHGALTGIQPSPIWGGNVVFVENHVTTAEPGSLVLNEAIQLHERRVINNDFDVKCNCNISILFMGLMGIEPHENGLPKTPEERLATLGVLKSSRCVVTNPSHYAVYARTFIESSCTEFPLMTVVIVCSTIVIFFLSLSICVFSAVRLQRQKQESMKLQESIMSRSFSTISRQIPPTSPATVSYCNEFSFPPGTSMYKTDGSNVQWIAAVPEIKTYHQDTTTELSERAESFRGSVSQLGTYEGRFVTRASCPFN